MERNLIIFVLLAVGVHSWMNFVLGPMYHVLTWPLLAFRVLRFSSACVFSNGGSVFVVLFLLPWCRLGSGVFFVPWSSSVFSLFLGLAVVRSCGPPGPAVPLVLLSAGPGFFWSSGLAVLQFPVPRFPGNAVPWSIIEPCKLASRPYDSLPNPSCEHCVCKWPNPALKKKTNLLQ